MFVQLLDIEIRRVTLADFVWIPLSVFFVVRSCLLDGAGKEGCGMCGETSLFGLDRFKLEVWRVFARVLFKGLRGVGRCRRGSCSENRE